MRYSIRTVTAASVVPLVLSTDEAKLHLRITGDASEDTLISAQIAAAQDWVEKFTSQVLTERVMEISFPAFPVLPDLIALPRDPITGIVSVTYTSADDGSEIVLDPADYRWSEAAPDVLKPAFREDWPIAADEAGAVRVQFNAGYGAGLAPAALVSAVRLMLGHLFENRETVVAGTIATSLPMGVKDLCEPYRRMSLL